MKRNIVIAACLIAAALCATAVYAAKPDDKKLAAEAKKGQQIVDTGWTQRCDKPDDKKTCEVFSRLMIKDSKARVAEMAVGFPPEAKTARGAVILPLGIMLEPGIAMKIDDGKAYAFKVHSCTEGGCLSYVNLDKDLLADFRKGKTASFIFRSGNGQPMQVQLNLAGLDKALKAIN
jgi:invasion protein IalB